MVQGSAEWHAARLGKVTASCLNDLLATVKNGEAASRRDYRMQLVVETLTGEPTEKYTNGDMKWGTEQEPFACDCYAFLKGYEVEQAGFIDHPEIVGYGASPDGLIGDDGLVEIKCPKTATHVEWMLAGVVPSQHYNQIQGQLDCTGRKWCDFASYDPRMPVDLQLFVVRVERDDCRIAEIRAAVMTMRKEVDDMVKKLTELQR